MHYINSHTTKNFNFYEKTDPYQLIDKYGSPLYVYNEKILRERCREIKNLVTYPHYTVNYSAKANSNLALLKIIRSEGLNVDAMSPGEIFVELKAGFTPDQILYIGNNVSVEELQYAVDAGVGISVDSISQLELFGKHFPGSKISVRFNPGIGTGHHKKVVTAGKNTKFGVDSKYILELKTILKKYNLHLTGINQHIGSLFMQGDSYIEAMKSLLNIAKNFDSLEFIDLGGGFGIPYKKQEHEKRLNLKELGEKLDQGIQEFVKDYGKKITIKVEPGRYIVAESSTLLGNVYAVKMNYDDKYIGTDLGFNVLIRPVLYNSHHDIEIYRKENNKSEKNEKVTIVGNICETGDIIAHDILLPEIFEGDILGILDAGAYGLAMSSNYNNRLRPAEVLIDENGDDILIRKRDSLEDLIRNYC